MTTEPESYGTAIKSANHRVTPFGPREPFDAVPTVPKPPDPSVGGMVGAGNQLGWSTGIGDPLRHRQRFAGATLVVPQVKMHGAYGPVGQSARQQRLANGVDAMTADYTPSSASVAQSFVGPVVVGRQSLLQREVGGYGR